jgi:hypothetical protein
MDDFVTFGSRAYALLLLLLLVARSMDFVSTWIATPNMVLEGNPLAKMLGWRWGIPVNAVLCFLFAFWPVPAVVISTTSVLVAARNFQSAWLMRSLGEQVYREWHIARLQEASPTLFLSCLLGQTFMFAIVGTAVIYFSDWNREPIVVSVGIGIIAYAMAVAFYTMIGLGRLRRASLRQSPHAESELLRLQATVFAKEFSPTHPGKTGEQSKPGVRNGSNVASGI